MKIILEAFNGLMKSKIMDVPERMDRIFKMELEQSSTALCAYDGSEYAKTPSVKRVFEFEYVGKNYALDNNDFARIYVLRDISK